MTPDPSLTESGVPRDWGAPDFDVPRDGPLPFLVEHWYLNSRTTRYMMVRRFSEVLAHADLRPGQCVLDLGCGWAYGTFWARAMGARVAGLDLGLDQLRWTRHALERGDTLGLTNANAKSLPFRGATFDRAFSVEMMEHVFRPDRPAVLAEIARVLKRGGRLAISTPNSSSPIEAAKRLAVRWPALRRRLPAACFPEAADDAGAYHPYRYHHPISAGELSQALAVSGFRVMGMKRFLWVVKTAPDAWLAAGRLTEAIAESLPLVNRLGATTLVWAERC